MMGGDVSRPCPLSSALVYSCHIPSVQQAELQIMQELRHSAEPWFSCVSCH